MSQVQKLTQPDAPVSADPMVDMIERVVLSPDLPMERITALIEIRERQMDKEAEQEFNRAFAAAMADMPDVPKSGRNKHLARSYSTLDDLIRTARPVLSKHGLSLNWETKSEGDVFTVKAIVRHSSGHFINTELSAPRDKSGSMNALQGGGSTETYLKRYSGFAILGLSSGDEQETDGERPAERVSTDQHKALEAALEHSGMDPKKFHSAFGHKDPENANLRDFPSSRFDEAINRLKQYVEAKANG